MSSSKKFFKIILCSTLYDHKLSIPDIFVRKYGDELTDLVKLVVPNGGIWHVRVERRNETVWLLDGIRKFMEDHSVGFGYFLLFTYKGNSTFKVNIFNLACFEIEYHNNSGYVLPSEDHDSDHGNNDTDKNTSIELLGYSAHGKDVVEYEDDISEFLSSSTDHQLPASTSKNKRSSIADVRKSKRHKNPSFEIRVKSYTLKSNNVFVPTDFARHYLPFPSEFVKLLDADGNEWEVRCYRTDYACFLAKGWSNFLKAKKLAVGDVCVFELIQINEEVKLNVKISRAR